MAKTSVLCVQVEEGKVQGARKLMGIQVCITTILLISICLPNMLWQMLVNGEVGHNDVAQNAIDNVLVNSSVIKSMPGLKDMNLTEIKEEWIKASSKENKDQTTVTIMLSCVGLVLLPCIGLCVTKAALENNDPTSMSCICMFEGITACVRLFTWFVPLTLAAVVCWNLEADRTFLKCGRIVPFVQQTVVQSALNNANQPQIGQANVVHYVNVSSIALEGKEVTFSAVLSELFTAMTVPSNFKSSYLDLIASRMDPAEVQEMMQGWVMTLKAQDPGSLEVQALANVTHNFFEFVFANTQAQQMSLCDDAVKAIYSCAQFLAIIFTIFAIVACCEVCACCIGSLEAWEARIDCGKPGSYRTVGVPLRVVEEERELLTREAPKYLKNTEGLVPRNPNDQFCCNTFQTCEQKLRTQWRP